jgi:hypothetical protein
MMNFVLIMKADTAQRFANHLEFVCFAEKIVRPCSHAALPVLAIWIVGDHNNNRCRWIFFDILKQVDSASAGQPYIQNDNIGMRFSDAIERFKRIAALSHNFDPCNICNRFR